MNRSTTNWFEQQKPSSFRTQTNLNSFFLLYFHSGFVVLPVYSPRALFLRDAHFCSFFSHIFLFQLFYTSKGKIHDEIDLILNGELDGERMPCYATDADRMPWTEAVICEVQRIKTILPLGVPHGTLDVNIQSLQYTLFPPAISSHTNCRENVFELKNGL